jgi:hypothetical protein
MKWLKLIKVLIAFTLAMAVWCAGIEVFIMLATTIPQGGLK